MARTALLVGALAGCEESGAKPTTTLQATDSADQVLEGFSHYVTSEGVRRSRVEADTAYFYESTQVTELRRIKVVFYDLKGVEVVVTPDGRRLQTERLRYDNAANTISTDQHFTFDRGTEHLEGNSFKSDPDFKNVITDRPRGVAGNGVLLPGQEQQ